MNNQIIEMAGLIVVCGAFYLMNLGKKKENEKLKETIAKKDDYLCAKQDIIRAYARKMKKQGNEIKDLHKTILFDNDVAIQRTEMLEQEQKQSKRLEKKLDQASNRFAKDQITITDLNHELCEANWKVIKLESEIDSMEHRGWRKIMRARRLVK